MRFADGEEMIAYLFADSDDSSFHFWQRKYNKAQSLVSQTELSFTEEDYKTLDERINEWILDDGIELKRWNAGLPEIKLNKYIARGVKNLVPRSITLMTTVPPQTSPECNC